MRRLGDVIVLLNKNFVEFFMEPNMRNDILTALLDQLETITTANGYQTNIGAKATYWDNYDSDYSGPETVTFRDSEANYEAVNAFYDLRLTVQVEAISYLTGADKLSKPAALLSDLRTALFDVRWWENTGAIKISPVMDTKDISALGKKACRVVLEIEIQYREDR